MIDNPLLLFLVAALVLLAAFDNEPRRDEVDRQAWGVRHFEAWWWRRGEER